jgi:diacylglycerol kinase family enzyme
MTTAGRERANRRGWAVAALAALALLLTGLVAAVVRSPKVVLPLAAVTALSLAVVAATGWWAFTTRRVWKRRLNLAIAGLVVADALLGLLVFGLGQALEALVVAAGALGYAAAAKRALRPAGLWTATSTQARGPLRSPSRGPRSGGRGSNAPSSGPGPGSHGPARPWLLVNPRSGGGKAERLELAGAARTRGVRVHLLVPGEDPAALAREAVAAGADAVGVAGGDGSLGLVARVAVESGVPFVCVPAGTRNHFAADLGLDRGDPLAALDAYGGPERRIDVGLVGERVFLNNVSLGAYADMVAEPGYRAAKLVTAHAVLPGALRGERDRLRVDLHDDEGRPIPDVLVLLVANNRYETHGTRGRLDDGVLQVTVLRARTGAALAGVAAQIAAGRRTQGRRWAQWTTTALRVDAPLPQLPAGIDGEAVTLEPPLEFRVLPRALRVLLPPALRPPAPRLRLHSPATVRRLLAVAAGRG